MRWLETLKQYVVSYSYEIQTPRDDHEIVHTTRTHLNRQVSAPEEVVQARAVEQVEVGDWVARLCGLVVLLWLLLLLRLTTPSPALLLFHQIPLHIANISQTHQINHA